MAIHSFLKAIGFSNIKNRKDLEKIIGITLDQPTEKYKKKISNTEIITEVKKDFGDITIISLIFFQLSVWQSNQKDRFILQLEIVIWLCTFQLDF